MLVVMLVAMVASVLSNHAPTYFSLSQLCLYFVYFVLGCSIFIYKDKLKEKRRIGLFAMFVPCMLVLFFHDGGMAMRCVMLLLSIMAVLGSYMAISANQNRLLMRLSKDSYGIYLFHSPLIYFMYTIYPDANPLVMLFVNFFLCGCASVGVVCLIRKIGLKFIIGEK